ncbi:MAG: nucleotide exchange factor GrpE [Pyrinomonadaceae bacterium]
MNQQNHIPKPDETLDELDVDTMSSVDDFIKELEAKEKDLHITADMTIEIEDSDFDTVALPDFVQQELAVAPSVPAARAAEPASKVRSPGSKTRIFELEQEIVKLNERISGLRADRNDVQEKSDRRLKDFENYKYRMDRERRGSFIDQISNLASQMLPVLDNLDRALDAAESIGREKSAEFEQFFNGIVLVNQQVNEVFAGMGVEPIKTVGEMFDPNFHEAVATDEQDDIPANTITEEMLRGYRIGNRVIRHSMVRVVAGKVRPRLAPAEDGSLTEGSAAGNDPLASQSSPAETNPTEASSEAE